jgi:hypothetical protein
MKPRFARLLRVAIAAAAALLCASTARATTLTFEELNPNPNPDVPVPGTLGTFESYAGFTWKDGRYAANFGPGPVFAPGFWLAARGHVTAYVPGNTSLVVSRPGRFGLVSAYVTATYRWTETLTVDGRRGGALVYSRTITPSYLPALFTFNFVDVDEVVFTVPGEQSGSVGIDDVEVTTPADTVPPTIELADVPVLTRTEGLLLQGRTFDQDGTTAGLSGAVLVGGTATPLAISGGAFQAWVPLAEGANEIVVEVRDPAGNVGRRAVTVTRDSVPPRVEFLAPAEGATIETIEFPVSVRVDDASAVGVVLDGWLAAPVINGVATATLAVPFREGPFAVSVQATDAAGNATSAWLPLFASLPDLALSVDVASGTAFGPLPGDLLAVRIAVTGPYESVVRVSSGEAFPVPAGGGGVEASFPLVEGPNALWVEAADLGGQTVALPVLVIYDRTPPEAAFLAPLDRTVVRGVVEVALEATDASTGVAAASFSVDGGPAVAGVGGPIWSASLDLGGLADGWHVVSAAVVDAVGNVASASVSVLVDGTPPSVSLLSPLPGSYASGTTAVSAEASDATSGVRSIRLLANGVQIGGCEASASCSAALDTTVLPDGPFVVAAVATDLAGNEALAQAMVIADNSAPSSFLRAPAPGQIVAGSLEVVFDVQDPGFAWAECTVGGLALGRSTEPAFRRTVDVTGVPDGPLDVACTAADLAGNEATEAVTVTVRNWTLKLDPRVLATSAKPGAGAVVTLYVEGPNVALLAPASVRALALAVPGGSPAPLVPTPSADQPGDADRDGIPDLTLKFERATLLSAIRGGVAAGAIAPGAPVTVRLVDGDRLLGATTVEVR